MPRRVGLFGGSFNPPHRAHLALARRARDELALDEVRWLPAGQPWQKPAGSQAPAADREAMVRLMVQGEPGFVVDARELERHGPSYTVDSVRELMAEQPGTDWFLLIGQDQYGRMDTWRDAAQLRSLVTLVVAARSGEAPMAPAAWTSQSHRMVVLPFPRTDLSATDIRQRAAAGQPLSALVGDAVARYIEQHRLYRVPPGH
jgi:nicotinate-nucleotide adenylyltransferase